MGGGEIRESGDCETIVCRPRGRHQLGFGIRSKPPVPRPDWNKPAIATGLRQRECQTNGVRSSGPKGFLWKPQGRAGGDKRLRAKGYCSFFGENC
jgi:hypothetical protein